MCSKNIHLSYFILTISGTCEFHVDVVGPIDELDQVSNEEKYSISPEDAKVLSDFSYTRRGHLMLDGFTFVRKIVNGAQNIIYWHCSEAKKRKCPARLKTCGKQLADVKHDHNHDPKREKAVNAIVWNDDSLE